MPAYQQSSSWYPTLPRHLHAYRRGAADPMRFKSLSQPGHWASAKRSKSAACSVNCRAISGFCAIDANRLAVAAICLYCPARLRASVVFMAPISALASDRPTAAGVVDRKDRRAAALSADWAADIRVAARADVPAGVADFLAAPLVESPGAAAAALAAVAAAADLAVEAAASRYLSCRRSTRRDRSSCAAAPSCAAVCAGRQCAGQSST
jgi:hypothetical protein